MRNIIYLAILTLALVGCKKFEAAGTGDGISSSSTSLGSSAPTPTPVVIVTPTPPPEPPLPQKAVVEPVAALMFNQIKQMSLASARPAAIKSDLDACFARLKEKITYDTIGTVPLQPDANNNNVAGDVIVPDANEANGSSIGGSYIVQRAEYVNSVSNLTGPSAASSFTARLVNNIVNVYGGLSVDTWAVKDITNAYGQVNVTAHAINGLDGEFAAGDPTVTAPKHCVSTQEFNTIAQVAGKVVVIGRGEFGDLGEGATISHIQGSIVSVGISVKDFNNLNQTMSDYIYLESSYTSDIRGVLGGVIYLNGSKVDDIANLGSNQTTVYLSNGSAVARVSGNVKLVQSP